MFVPDSITVSEARFSDWRARLQAAADAVSALDADQPPHLSGRAMFWTCTCELDGFRQWLAGQIADADKALAALDDMKSGARLTMLEHACASVIPDRISAEKVPAR